jgi:predicted adenylyl cyclase CyaB
MPSNIEIKAHARSPERFRELAELLSDTPPETIRQCDTFFPCPNGRLKLRRLSARAGELISYQRADVAGIKQSNYIIARTSRPDELLAVLSSALGVACTVMKTRMLWRVGQARIHLDSVLGLGFFVELEIVLQDGQSSADGHRMARELMSSLEIHEDDLLRGSYADLLGSEQDRPVDTNLAAMRRPLPSGPTRRPRATRP